MLADFLPTTTVLCGPAGAAFTYRRSPIRVEPGVPQRHRPGVPYYAPGLGNRSSQLMRKPLEQAPCGPEVSEHPL
jgi:hypothetical protein